MRETTTEEYREELRQYLKIQEEGEEHYPDCARCHGSHYVSAVTNPDAYHYVWESFPCPLCHEVGTIAVETSIEWLMEKAEIEDLSELDEEEENVP